MTTNKNHYCSFCGKSNEDVEKMIAKKEGHEIMAICNECVLDCVAILIKPQGKKEAKDAAI